MSVEPQPSWAASLSMSSHERLSRIAELLGVPVQAFYGSVANRDASEQLRREQEARLLLLIKDHLCSSTSEARRHFVEAVQALLTIEPR